MDAGATKHLKLAICKIFLSDFSQVLLGLDPICCGSDVDGRYGAYAERHFSAQFYPVKYAAHAASPCGILCCAIHAV